ncbi:MAG: hypothetical protein GY851_20345 [bacterium]|nr:hypothetical protein [bacterium]
MRTERTSSTGRRVAATAVAVIALVVCGAGCCHRGDTVTSVPPEACADTVELLPIENGYLAAHCSSDHSDDIVHVRFVFDLRALEKAHALWSAARGASDDADAAEGRGGSSESSLGFVETFAEASRLFREATRDLPAAGQELIEVNVSLRQWFVFSVKSEGKWLVRRPTAAGDRTRIAKHFWPVWLERRMRDPLKQIYWDETTDMYVPVKAINDFDAARAKFVVTWAGKEYAGVGTNNGYGCAVPGLGEIAGGDFREVSPYHPDRAVGTYAVRLIVPSRSVDFANSEATVEIVRMLPCAEGE